MSITNVDNQEMAKQLTSGVVNNIQEQIQNETIAVSNQKMDVNPIIEKQQNVPRAKKLHKTQHKEPTIEELHEIKQAKMMEIRELQKQEDLLKRSAVLSKSKVSKSCVKLWKSEFTQQEMSQIKKIKKKQRQYQRQLKKKEENLEKWLQEQRLEDQELKKKFIAQQCQQRKKELTKQRQQLQKKKRQRQLLFQEEIKHMKQNKTKKLLHHQMVQSWKKYQQAIQTEKSRALAVEKERLRVNSKIIQEHQAKYLQLKKDQQKKREKALEESRSAQLHLPYIRSQIFYKVQKQEQEKAQLEKMKIHEVQNNMIRKKQYGKLVIDQFLPKLKHHSASKQKEDSKSITKGILSGQESYKLGNNYMRSVHVKITKEHIEKQKNSLKITEQAGGNSVFYKNYLKQLKSENQKQNKPTAHEIVDETMRNTKMSEIEKLHKVRMLLDKDTGIKKSDSDMVETLRSKIKVLNQIMH